MLYSIVLAAGGSSRFGSPKQLAQVFGQALLPRTVGVASSITGDRTVVVLGAYATELRRSLGEFSGSVLVNPDWKEGLSSSLRAGLLALPTACTAALVTLADQPAIGADDLLSLVGAWRRQPDRAAAACHSGTVGAPAIFPRHMFSELAALRGDVGARAVLMKQSGTLTQVSMPSASLDVDTPEDLKVLGSSSAS